MGAVSRQRLVVALVLLAAIPAALELPALATLAVATVLLCALIAYEAVHVAEARTASATKLASEPGTEQPT